MKKNLLAILLLLWVPLTSTGQAQTGKSKRSRSPQDARQTRQPVENDKVIDETEIREPKRVSKQAFVELLDKGRKMFESGELDLNSPIEMEVSADRGQSGTLSNIGINQKRIDAAQRELVREFLEALSASGALEFLDGVEHMLFTLKLNDHALSVSASSEMPSAKKAAQFAKASSLLLSVGAAAKRGRAEEVVYQSANISSSGRRIKATLSLPRDTVANLLSKRLQPSSGQ